MLVISHITSPTAQIFPLREICRRASAAGILTIVDGVLALGQLDLDLDALGADFYVGNCQRGSEPNHQADGAAPSAHEGINAT